MAIHAGRILSTFYQCGEGYRLDPFTLETQGTEGRVPLDGISAHAKVDLATGELLFFNYSRHAPFMHYGVVGADNKLGHYVPSPAGSCSAAWSSTISTRARARNCTSDQAGLAARPLSPRA